MSSLFQQSITPDGQAPSGVDLQQLTDSIYHIQDGLGAAVGSVRDTVTPPPLPGGVATVVRWIFGVPQAIQIGGLVVGLVVATWLTRVVWRNRESIIEWLRTRQPGVQLSIAGALLVLVAGSAFAGSKSWNYMQHDNGFCTGCHVMETPFQRFAGGAGKHDSLQCHDCHQQSIFASTRQLVLWVANRPVTIDDHAPVPNARCESCHSTDEDREPWQHVRRMAGHKVHFESDSVALDSLLCVSCHGKEVHEFIPSGSTCAGSGCHEQQEIKLEGMADLPDISCVTCHRFDADLVPMTTRDSAVRALIPQENQCLSCHEMATRLPDFDISIDPHSGSCGTCHDVHDDSLSADAFVRCESCHEADLLRSAFHDGVSHREIKQDCLTCHQPHAASVDASDCAGCHEAARKGGVTGAPAAFDTTDVLRRRVSAVHDPPQDSERGKGDLPPPTEDASPPRPHRVVGVVAVDSFPHSKHEELACLTCHLVDSPTESLTFEAPRGCDLCHHQDAISGKVQNQDCTNCHKSIASAGELVATVTVATAGHDPRQRPVRFDHDEHETTRCADCHTSPDLSLTDSAATCTGCHTEHHSSEVDCATCHGELANAAQGPDAHRRDNHTGCNACHDPATVAALLPNRAFCLTCHEPEQRHERARECTSCHFLASPEQFRQHLSGGKPQ